MAIWESIHYVNDFRFNNNLFFLVLSADLSKYKSGLELKK